MLGVWNASLSQDMNEVGQYSSLEGDASGLWPQGVPVIIRGDAENIEGTLTNHHHMERFSTVMMPVSQMLPCWDSTIRHLVI